MNDAEILCSDLEKLANVFGLYQKAIMEWNCHLLDTAALIEHAEFVATYVTVRKRYAELGKKCSDLILVPGPMTNGMRLSTIIQSQSKPYFKILGHQWTSLDEVESAINMKAFL